MEFPVQLRNPSLIESRGLIAGAWKTASKTFPVYDPSTEEILIECCDFDRADFFEAVKSAQQGYKNYYRNSTAKERGLILRKWNDLILANLDDLAYILSLENGKTLPEAKMEVMSSASFISWFSEEASRAYGDYIPSSFKNTMVFTTKEPVGVCGIITPWNFPAAMIARKVAPALAAGCSVVIKPPSETPLSALAFAKLAVEAGIPVDCIHVIPTKNRSASLELVENQSVRKISFTGSTNVGKMLTRAAAGTMKKVSMELGGNAPFIVFEDADLEKAVDGALASKFRASGQTCVCANRFIVHGKVISQFTERLVEKVRRLNVGRGINTGVTQGPLINAAAISNVKKIVQDAVDRGATINIGGKAMDRPGFFFEPTVITDVTRDMLVATKEIFGPVAPIFSFTSDDDALELANSTELGLAGYFYSQDISRCMRAAHALECGMVGVNTGLMSACETPFGGIKESGIGKEGSKYGLEEYQTIKAVTIGNL